MEALGWRMFGWTLAARLVGLLVVISRLGQASPAPLAMLIAGLLGSLLCAVGLGAKISEIHAAAQRQRFLRELSALSVSEPAAVLCPLQANGSAAIQAIVTPLLRSLPPEGSEVTPASPPPGRGDEASAVE